MKSAKVITFSHTTLHFYDPNRAQWTGNQKFLEIISECSHYSTIWSKATPKYYVLLRKFLSAKLPCYYVKKYTGVHLWFTRSEQESKEVNVLSLETAYTLCFKDWWMNISLDNLAVWYTHKKKIRDIWCGHQPTSFGLY